MKISENKYVTLSYDLNVGEGEERELMEQATAERPMEFIFGTNSMLEAFEKQLEGLSKGDTFSFQLTPEEAYGDYDDSKIVELPKHIFEIDGKIDDQVLFDSVELRDLLGAGELNAVALVIVEADRIDPIALALRNGHAGTAVKTA